MCDITLTDDVWGCDSRDLLYPWHKPRLLWLKQAAGSIKLARCELVLKSTYVSKYPFSVQAVDKAHGCLRSRHQEVTHS